MKCNFQLPVKVIQLLPREPSSVLFSFACHSACVPFPALSELIPQVACAHVPVAVECL